MNWTALIVAALLSLLAGFLAGRKRRSPGDLDLLRRTLRELPYRVFLVDAGGTIVETPHAAGVAASEPGAEQIAARRSEIAGALRHGGALEAALEFNGRAWYMLVKPIPLDASNNAALITFRERFSDDSSVEDLAARNSAILQSSMDGFFIIGDDFRFIEVNAAYCRMVGFSAAELLGMKIADLEIPLADARGAATNISRTGHHLFAAEHRHKEGHVVELEISVIALRSGKRKTLVGFARNVTDRRRAERALAEREKQYRDLVETSHDLIWSVDGEGRWTFVNREAVWRIYGYEPEELLGRLFVDILSPDRVGPDQRKFQEILAGRPCYGYETVHLRKDGTLVTLLFNAIAMRDEKGAVIGATGTAADITDRKQAEERLRAATDRFESVVRRMPLGYVLWDTNFVVQAWNPAAEAIFGYSSEEAVGKNGDEMIVPPTSRDEMRTMWRRMIAGAARDHAVHTLQRRDGESIRCEWSNAVIYDAGGAVSHIATLIRDISERERIETQLRRTQKMESLGILAGGVAHDFNNALVGILCNAALALEKLPTGSEARDYLGRILNAGRRSSELTRQMLVYAGRAAPEVRPLDLNELIREMSDLLGASIAKSVSLSVNLQNELPLVEADAGQLQQVIMNLIINAAEAIGETSGVVTISSYVREVDVRQIAAMYSDAQIVPGKFLCLEISDTGCGMTPEVQARIFDPFFSTKFTGRGLGLAAILGIVRSHRGAIRVVSKPGTGTTFTVLLPISHAAAQAPRKEGGHDPRLLAGVTVLVVDDEPDVREVVEAVLSGHGCRIVTARDGPQALEIFRERPDEFDVVLLDMTMPGMNGEVVYRELCAIREDVNVVFSSGYTDSNVQNRVSVAGAAVGFVAKPYTVDQLAAAIRRAMASKAPISSGQSEN